jgi:hypothetical protein
MAVLHYVMFITGVCFPYTPGGNKGGAIEYMSPEIQVRISLVEYYIYYHFHSQYRGVVLFCSQLFSD